MGGPLDLAQAARIVRLAYYVTRWWRTWLNAPNGTPGDGGQSWGGELLAEAPAAGQGARLAGAGPVPDGLLHDEITS